MTAPELIPLAGDWAIWPLAGLRCAGLPADRVLALAGDGSAATEGLAADPWFVEAVTWQNRAVVNRWLGEYSARLAAGDNTLRRRSSREGQIARYAQRYATKNDTIGFFGPIGWATIDPAAGGGVRAAARGREVCRRAYFETWALTELAELWSADRSLLAHLPPWRDPSARLMGDRLVRARQSPIDLAPDEAAVLRLCDGTTSPAAILARLEREHPELGFANRDEVLSVLSVLRRRGCLSWGLRLPVDERAERHLITQLAAVSEEAVRERYLGPLLELVRLRDDVDKAAGDPPALLDALNMISDRFTELTAAPADRDKQERGTGRGLLWMDAVADWRVTVGRDALAEIGAPLGLLADTCRWLTWRVGQGMAEVVRQRLARTEQGRMPFATLVAELAPELAGAPGGVLDTVLDQVRDKVSALLPLPAHGPLHTAVEDVADGWAAAFDAPRPGWEGARLHSPDLMLSTSDVDAPGAADCWVLGEIHVAVNTLDNRIFVLHQQEPGEIERLVGRSTFGVRYVPAVARNWSNVTSRTYPPLTVDVPERFVYWALEADDVLPVGVTRVPAAGLTVTSGVDGPVVVDGAGLVAPFVEFIGELLSFLVVNAFTLFPRLPHVPRVRLGRLVIQRETWHLDIDAVLAGAPASGGEERLAANLRACGVPSHSFVQVPGDSKPIFCDLDSALLVRNLLRLLHGTSGSGAVVRIQEMVPDFEHLWLMDQSGGRRTSEFRTVVVDTRGKERL